jgi:predicted nuclease with TOPRIM domain
MKVPKIDLEDMREYYAELCKEKQELLKERNYTAIRMNSLEEEIDKIEILLENEELKQNNKDIEVK